MKLKRISGKTMYKSMDSNGWNGFRRHHIPGFIAEPELALIYAQPSLTGEPTDIRYLIGVGIDPDVVEDLSNEVSDMCDGNWKQSPYKDRIWTAYGSGHGGKEALYYGQPASDFELITVIKGDDHWKQLFDEFKSRGTVNGRRL